MLRRTLCFAFFVSACGSPRPTETSRVAGHNAEVAPGAPALVVAIVVDQLPSDALLEYLPHLPEDGLLRRMVTSGTFVERARIEYANTSTGPGHAAIHTGRSPFETGVDANANWDIETGRELPIIAQAGQPVFGVEGQVAGPAVLRSRTVADILRAEHPSAKIVSLSHKARSAILSAGRNADAVVWYESTLPGFVTSAAYAEAMPSWLSAFNSKRPTSSALADWSAEQPALYERLFGPDDAPGEANWLGLGTIFPHKVSQADDPEKVLLTSPHSVDYLLDLTRAAAAEYALGQDEVPDILCLSISTTDYAGHSFSPASWEYLDVLIKTDRALGKLVAELEAKSKGPVSVLVTSDHGGPKLPERSGRGGRILHAELVAALDAAAEQELGKGPWVSAFVHPYLYLSARAQERRSEVVPILRDAIASMPSVAKLVDAQQAQEWLGSKDPLKLAVARSMVTDRKELYVLASPGFFSGADRKPDLSKGINHGSPEDHDRNVPVLLMGPGIPGGVVVEKASHAQVAPTMSRMLIIESPTERSAVEAHK